MGMKEKLVELVGQVQDCGCDVTDVVRMNYVENTVLVNHLIANGVTVQEWISVKDRMPESGKDAVLIALRWGAVDIGWCEEGRWGSEFVNEYDDGEVTHWTPLLQPPKGE